MELAALASSCSIFGGVMSIIKLIKRTFFPVRAVPKDLKFPKYKECYIINPNVYMTPEEFVDAIEDHFLGPDRYVINPVSKRQADAEFFFNIVTRFLGYDGKRMSEEEAYCLVAHEEKD